MDDERIYRLVFALLYFTLFGIVATYRWKAAIGRRIDYSKEGRLRCTLLRLAGLMVWLYGPLYVAYPEILSATFMPLPAAARWSGAGLVAALIPFVVWSQRSLDRNVSPTVSTHPDHQLITHGAYRWIRHPLYATGLLAFTGLGLIAASWFLLAAAVLSVGFVLLRLPKEEAELVARFGEAYREYKRQTGSFIPRSRRNPKRRPN